MLLRYSFHDFIDCIYIRTRPDGKPYNIARLRARTKVRKFLIHEMLFADDAALTSHTVKGLQELVSFLHHDCRSLGLTINLKRTNILTQDSTSSPHITINGTILEVADYFTYLGSIISISLNLDTEIGSRIIQCRHSHGHAKQARL